MPESRSKPAAGTGRAARLAGTAKPAAKSVGLRGMPKPGVPVRGSETGRPIMALLDLLGRRWVMRVLWELRDARVLTFRELQGACSQVSPTVLNTRLAELREAGFVEHDAGSGYRLSAEGNRLLQSLLPLEALAKRWEARQPT
jgi:DNA-binding HxlR family transcriptional regulator